MDNITLSVSIKDSKDRLTFADCLSFNYIKERYTPYSVFSGSFLINETFGEIVDVEVTVNNTLIHKGVVDICKKTISSKGMVLYISSRGYSLSLGHCMLANEIKYGLTLTQLITQSYAPPYVTYSDTGKSVNYLYIKEHASLWEAVVNHSLKLANFYPYISYPNKISCSMPVSNKNVLLNNPNTIISYSENADNTKIISHIHMRDLDGTYNSYNLENSYATSRKIIRHKHINYDRQWTSDSSNGLQYKMNYFMRGSKSFEVVYRGFNGEDINDAFSIQTNLIVMPSKNISAVNISGNNKGIFTKLTAYVDNYNNN